ncbi:MAG: ferredoxin [Acidimicrobiales bacterium]|nr:ferredoxin [Acidimicrobiales bacterium]MCB9395952.1 ferredoxin [Acidimicrobiaceae bacterium]
MVSPEGRSLRIKAHPGLCAGWGNCHRFAPDVYPLDEHGQIAVHLFEVDAEHADDAWLGAQACPQSAISVIVR